MIFEGSRYRGGFMYKTLAMSAIVSFCTGLPLNGGLLAEVISNKTHDSMMTSPCFLASFALNHYVGHRKFTGVKLLQSLGFVSELNVDL